GQASNDSPTSRSAFVWQNGLITDLNTLIDSGLGWVLQIATGINDNGQITGTGTVGGQTHAFLLTPNPQRAAGAHESDSPAGGMRGRRPHACCHAATSRRLRL